MRENALAKLNHEETVRHPKTMSGGASGYTLDGSSQTTVASTQDGRDSSNNSSQNSKRNGILRIFKMKDIIMQKSRTLRTFYPKKRVKSEKNLSWLPSWQKLEEKDGSTILPYQEISELFSGPTRPTTRNSGSSSRSG